MAEDVADDRRRRRELAKRFHPDAGGTDEDFIKAFADLDSPPPVAAKLVKVAQPRFGTSAVRTMKRFVRRRNRRRFITLN